MFSPFDLFSSLRQGHPRHSAIRALSSLPAAQLRDLGIAPDQIGEVVEGLMQSRRERDAAAQASAARLLNLPFRSSTASVCR